MTGPRASEGGYDYMMQGLAGWMSLTGDPDGPPTKSGLSLVDLSGGYASVIAVLAGLWRARRDGVGCDCDVSLFETALHELMYVGTWAASRGYVPPRRRNSAHPSIVPFQAFPTADGWIVVACPKQKFWEALCAAIGRPELARDPRFDDFAARDRNRDELEPILESVFGNRSSDEWLRVLHEAGVPSSAVNEVSAALDEARLVEYDHPQLGTVRQVASPLRMSGPEPPPEGHPSAASTRSRRWWSCAAIRRSASRSWTPPASSETTKGGDMPRQALQPDGVAVPRPPFSPVVVSGDLVYTAGQVAHDADGALVAGGIEEQTTDAREHTHLPRCGRVHAGRRVEGERVPR